MARISESEIERIKQEVSVERLAEARGIRLDRVHQVQQVIGEIADATVEQSRGIEQVAAAVEQVNHLTQQTAANAEGSASAAEELSGQAPEVTSLVGEFRLTAEAVRWPDSLSLGQAGFIVDRILLGVECPPCRRCERA